MRTNQDLRDHHTGRSARPATRPALLGAALLWFAGCGVTGVQSDPAAQEVMDTLNGYVGADGRTGCTVDLDGGGGACRSEVEWQRIVEQTCPAHGLRLVAYKTFEDCGPGKHRRVAYACCPDEAPPSPPGPMCKDVKLGDANLCQGLDTWKTKAAATCEASKLQLTNLTPGAACGMGLYRTVTATCCAAPTPPPLMCVMSKLGDGRTCVDPAAWKMKATQECAAKNLVLTDLKPTVMCGMGGYSVVEISCCATGGGGGGGTGACFSGTVGAPGTCRSPDALKMEATSLCISKMYQLRDFGLGAICDRAGNVSEAKYTCCP